MPLVRAFIAIELPPDVLAQIGRLQDRVRQDVPPGLVRWVRPAGIHLTLKFLGDVDQGQLPEIGRALCEACARHAPLELQIGELGCFPNARRPRVLWVGVQDEGAALRDLQRDVERAISPLGFPPDRRGFHPHLTLGRVKASRPSRRKQAEWEALGAYAARARARVGQLSVEAVHLMRSELLPSGAVYSSLATCPLAAQGPRSG
jgi:2'-5' RNA ligase